MLHSVRVCVVCARQVGLEEVLGSEIQPAAPQDYEREKRYVIRLASPMRFLHWPLRGASEAGNECARAAYMDEERKLSLPHCE